MLLQKNIVKKYLGMLDEQHIIYATTKKHRKEVFRHA